MNIVFVDSDITSEREKLIAFLAQFESQALFLLGNLLNPTQKSCLYACIENGAITGVCGFYPTFRSCTLFSTNEEASKALAYHVAGHHDFLFLLGMAKSVQPALDALISHGKILVTSPEYLFFELDIEHEFIPYTLSEGTIRPMEERDASAIARLHRYLQETSQDLALRNEELAQVRASPVLFCLEIDGRIVSVASSNGLAFTTFQILGVVTDPAYRSRGCAKAVCSRLISFMRDKGAKKAVLFTKHDNTAAIACYRSLGFKITDRYCVAEFQS